MSGIVVSIGSRDSRIVDRLSESVSHRGPNDSGVFVDPEIGVAMAVRRLSVVDGANGHQPMSNTDGSLWVAFDGQIFNAPQLRRRLEASGRRFLSQNSDTEVLLHLYEEKGDAMAADLNGFFAFVILDRKERRVFGARDRFGMKPLYYTKTGTGMTLASEIKALLRLPGAEPAVNRQSVFHYLSLGYVPGVDSIIEGIRRVPPAHTFVWDFSRSEISFRRYWQPRLDAKHGLVDQEAVEILRDGLGASVERWSLSDGSVACALSGRLDSAVIASLYASRTAQRLTTFTVGFSDGSLRPPANLAVARHTAGLLSSDHHELTVSAEEVINDIVPMAWHLEEPHSGGLLPWFVFKIMASEGKVALTGTGADEVFGGDGKWRALERWPVRTQMRKWRDGGMSGWAHLFGLGGSPIAGAYMKSASMLPDREKRSDVFIDSREMSDTATLFEDLFREAGTSDVRDASTWADLNAQLTGAALPMADRFSMGHGMQARMPYLDHEFVQSMLSIPSSLRTHPRDLKRLLRRAARHTLPDELIDSTRGPDELPVGHWLRTVLRASAESLLSSERLQKQGLMNPAYYADLLSAHQKGADHSKTLWRAFMFQVWHRIFIEDRCHSRPTFSLLDILERA